MTIIFSNLKIKGHYGSYFTNVLCCFFIVEGRNRAVASMYSWGGGGGVDKIKLYLTTVKNSSGFTTRHTVTDKI